MVLSGITEKPTVLIVDDTPDNLTLLSELLRGLYRVKAARNGEKALQIAGAEDPPDLILLDVMMPGISGFEVCRQLKAQAHTRDIPVIFLTTLDATEDEMCGLELGAVDYITKPITPSTVLLRVDNQLKVKAAADFLRDKNDYLEQEVARRTREMTAIQDVTILAMASLAETRDNETSNHIRRTQFYLQALAEQLKDHPRFAAELDEDTRGLLFKSAPLHDIGKVGIPDRILLKPGRFTPEEFEIMKTHTSLGRDALQQAEERLGMAVPFLRLAKEIAYSHQEKWDGSGYPEGWAGDAIPLSARLMAVADVYDALISRRVYKEGMPHEQAVTIISEGRGSHFDPDIVDAFVALQDEFRAIALRYTDSDQDLARKAERRDKSADAVAAIAGSRVLLVEDNEMNRELALELLNDDGLSVAVACHGQEALDLLAADPHFDGILMDCQMPVMDGYTATRAIRQRPELAGIPIIAMTANTMAGDREQALAAGMDDHIGKPLNVDAMFGTLARWIKPRGGTPQPLDEPGRSGELPGIDQRAGLATCGGKADLYRRMLLKFHEGQHDFAAAFAAATWEADPEAAQRAAHTLRGTAASIGAMGVAQAAGRLEAACKEAAAAPVGRGAGRPGAGQPGPASAFAGAPGRIAAGRARSRARHRAAATPARQPGRQRHRSG